MDRKVEARGGCTGKGRPLHFLTATSLCPLIWGYIVTMLLVFLRKARAAGQLRGCLSAARRCLPLQTAAWPPVLALPGTSSCTA